MELFDFVILYFLGFFFFKNAIQIFDEIQQKQNNNIDDIMTRLEVANLATLAEVNFFGNQIFPDFNMYMRLFLSKQIEFYSQVCIFFKCFCLYI